MVQTAACVCEASEAGGTVMQSIKTGRKIKLASASARQPVSDRMTHTCAN